MLLPNNREVSNMCEYVNQKAETRCAPPNKNPSIVLVLEEIWHWQSKWLSHKKKKREWGWVFVLESEHLIHPCTCDCIASISFEYLLLSNSAMVCLFIRSDANRFSTKKREIREQLYERDWHTCVPLVIRGISAFASNSNVFLHWKQVDKSVL
jgi:hypothetical protein